MLLGTSLSFSLWARDVFLNGNDISNAKRQKLEDVDVLIDKDGNIFISASHYKVKMEETYYPLNKSQLYPKHKTPQKSTSPGSQSMRSSKDSTGSVKKESDPPEEEKWHSLEGAKGSETEAEPTDGLLIPEREMIPEPIEPATPQVPSEPSPQVL